MKIGFIGLGVMGRPMALNLIKKGHRLTIVDRKDETTKYFRDLQTVVVNTPAEVAKQNNVVITMLPDSPDVDLVALGENGLVHGAHPGLILIDMSSINPLESKRIGSELLKHGIEMLDAPVSGGEPKAIDATLSIMVGGPRGVFDEYQEILKQMGSSAIYVGELGAGNITKLANQIIVASNIAALAEAYMLASKAGVETQLVFEAIRGGLAGSTVMESKSAMMFNHNFAPGFRVELHRKDLQNVINTASRLHAPIPLTGQLFEMMKTLELHGHAKEDHSSLSLYYELLANQLL